MSTSPELRLRRSARVFLFDREGRILLIRFVAVRDGKPWTFWVTPGGEIETGEPKVVAAMREVYEELGIRPILSGPVHTESGSEYEHLGERVRNEDTFFAAICNAEEPKLRGVTASEIQLMREARWFSAEQLAELPDSVFPATLPELGPKVFAALRQAENPRK